MTHCSWSSRDWAAATSARARFEALVPRLDGVAPAWETTLPSAREYAVTPRAAAVSAVLTADMPPAPFCWATRSLLAPSWPTLPTMCAPIAAALTGVHRSQPALATAPVALSLPASAAAALRATALARVPPNQAARPTSCSERDRVLGAMAGLLEMPGTGCPAVTRRFPLHAADLRTRTVSSGQAGGPCCSESR